MRRCRHAELTVSSPGRYYVTDTGSLRGTKVFRSGEWTPFRQGYVNLDERLRFGTFEMKLARLLDNNACSLNARPPRAGVNSGRPQQNVGYGKLEGGPVNAK